MPRPRSPAVRPVVRPARLPGSVRPGRLAPGHATPHWFRTLPAFLVPAVVLGLLVGCGPAPLPPSGLLALDPATNQPSADPEARPHYHNFGRIAFGERVHHAFRFQNTDPAPVTIHQVQSSCGCSVADLRRVDRAGNVLEQGRPDQPGALLVVPPGGLCEIELRVDTQALSQRDAPKLVTVRVGTDSVQRPWITLEATLHVELGFVYTPATLELSRVPQGQGAAGSVVIRREGDLGLRLSGVLDHPPGFDVELTDDPGQPGDLWHLSVVVPPGLPPGSTIGNVRLGTRGPDGEPGRELTIPVVARILADIAVQPSQLILRSRGDAETVEQEARIESLVDGLRFRIEQAELIGVGAEHLKVESVPLDPDTRGRSRLWTVRLIAPRSALETPLGGTLRLTLDDAQTPTIELRYAAMRR
ncbi:MAG: DUF1573 domain-containing protein [Planctomycetaceae bacterium]|nr:DUF1573 domain-containing protein [Planctomycetaceae bacterium]